MGLTAKHIIEREEMIIQIDGRFDFHVHANFRDAYSDIPPTTTFIIDLAKTTYIDSSAMGMLLLLREHVGKDSNSIRIINTAPGVRKALSISNLDKLFSVE